MSARPGIVVTRQRVLPDDLHDQPAPLGAPPTTHKQERTLVTVEVRVHFPVGRTDDAYGLLVEAYQEAMRGIEALGAMYR